MPCFDGFTTGYMGAGLKMYDWAACKARLFRSRFLSRATTLSRLPLLRRDRLVGSVVYADGQFDDGRYNLALVKTMVEAVNHARVLFFATNDQGKLCSAEVEIQLTGERFSIRATAFVNATGPWADTIRRLANPHLSPRIRVSKGIHIFLSLDLHQSNSALLIPKTEDGRVLFAVPWYGLLQVGTTENEVSIDDEMCVTSDEVDSVLRHLNQYLEIPVSPEHIGSGTARMRPLVSAGSSQITIKLARDHVIKRDSASDRISIMGGTWTTYRAMAEDTIDEVQKYLGQKPVPAKTRDLCLAGSEDYSPDFWKSLVANYVISEATEHHLAVKFGSRAIPLLNLIREDPTLAEPIVPGFSSLRADIAHAVQQETASTVDDALTRRTGIDLLSCKAACAAAPLTGALPAKELGWNSDFQQDAVWSHERKITRMIELARLRDRQLASLPFRERHS